MTLQTKSDGFSSLSLLLAALYVVNLVNQLAIP